jgi:1,4-dihydroxy-6-naphthoate synthase
MQDNVNINKYTLAYSPCPNDTYIFYAMIHQEVTCDNLYFDVIHADVEQLNQAAKQGQYDITKLSFHAMGHLLGNYTILKTGAALGYNCGPLIVAPKGCDQSVLNANIIAVPGIWTTANLLLGLYLKNNPNVTPMSFETIMPAIQQRKCVAGVIIHEGRFTYHNYGLTCLMDLGKWWEDETGLPVPLGCIALKRNLSYLSASIEQCMKNSLNFSKRHPEKATKYIKQHAQETSDDVIRQHIDLYVNNDTSYLSKTGMRAIETLFERARSLGLIPDFVGDIF